MDYHSGAQSRPGSARVLVVEDDPDAREIVSRALERSDYLVTQAEDGAKAIQIALESTFDVILLDLELPKVNGLEVLKILQGCPETSGTPVIIMTTHDEPEFIEKCFRMGVDGYLLKPIQKEYMVGMLTRLLAGSMQEPDAFRQVA